MVLQIQGVPLWYCTMEEKAWAAFPKSIVSLNNLHRKPIETINFHQATINLSLRCFWEPQSWTLPSLCQQYKRVSVSVLCSRVFWRFCATLSDFADITVLRQNDANRVHNLIHYSRWIICILNLLQAEMLFSLIQCSPPTFPCRPLKKERFHSCHPVARFRIVRMCTASPTGLEWNHSTPCKQTAISPF